MLPLVAINRVALKGAAEVGRPSTQLDCEVRGHVAFPEHTSLSMNRGPLQQETPAKRVPGRAL